MVPVGSPISGAPRDEEFVTRALTRSVDLLRTQGHRVTGARRAVIEALARHGGHPGAAELSAQIELQHPGVHLGTVYRTLELLVDFGVVTHVHMDHGATAYHLATIDAARQHLHARCHSCGRVIDLPADLLDPVRHRLAAERDFVLDARHMALSGTCQACNEKGGDSPDG